MIINNNKIDSILVLDFGGQYNLLIARLVREMNVYAEVVPYNKITIEEILEKGYKGIIFTGGPNSVYEESSPHYDKKITEIGVPILGICYGHQLLSYMTDGKIDSALDSSEYGKTIVRTDNNNVLFSDIDKTESTCWMSHRDYVSVLPKGFKRIASTDKCDNAGIANDSKKLYGVQFHPEVTHTEIGKQILKNFVLKVCKACQNWKMDDFIESTVKKIKERVGDKKVLLGLSGGVDSSVTALLLERAIKDHLICVFIDHGLLRYKESEMVEETFSGKFGLKFIRVDARERFLNKLKGVTEPEKKRKIIGEEFIRAFEEEKKKIIDQEGRIEFLAQGTIYPDVIESGKGDSATIKSHHNVGGLPKDIDFSEIIEPLRDLFKDEVRIVGSKLGLPDSLVNRQPFPGPGLAVRIIGEITPEKIDSLQKADHIFREEMEKNKVYSSQYFAVLTGIKSVGVQGDSRTYGYTCALRAVNTTDFMTATFTRVPYEVLEAASSRITNEIESINRVVFDITSKPPATIEWE